MNPTLTLCCDVSPVLTPESDFPWYARYECPQCQNTTIPCYSAIGATELMARNAWNEMREEDLQFDKECDEAWERIEKMTPEEVTASLYEHGYTEESLAASFERFKELLRKHGGNPQ